MMEIDIGVTNVSLRVIYRIQRLGYLFALYTTVQQTVADPEILEPEGAVPARYNF